VPESEDSLPTTGIQPPPTDALSSLVAGRPLVEREGLPKSYQMRADSHYVDHLESQHHGPPIRLINTRHLDAGAQSSAVSLTKLAESIAANGVLQPLLVRRQNGRYQVIAGHKRLAAAIAAGVVDVPCLTYDVNDAEAAALAEADNIRAPAVTDRGSPARDAECLDVLRAVSRDLAAIDASAAVLTRTRGGTLHQRVTADLIQAQAWRLAWLAEAALVVANQHGGSRPTSIVSIVDRVKAGFAAQARLTSLRLDCAVGRTAASVALDEDLGAVAIAGCVFATLGWLDDYQEPKIEVRADISTAGTLRVEVVQRMAPVGEEAAGFLREPALPRARDLTTALGLLTAKSVTARYGGTVALSPIGTGGSVIRSTFCKFGENSDRP
jgi:ParB/RepB/Spo0J family partition protein